MWAAWGAAPNDSWKVRLRSNHALNANLSCLLIQYKIFKWGERVADRVEFEETALRVIDTAYKPPENQSLLEKDATLIPLLYPSLLAGRDPLGSWQTHIQFRIPYHKRYMNLWLLGQSTLCIIYDILVHYLLIQVSPSLFQSELLVSGFQAWAYKCHS